MPKLRSPFPEEAIQASVREFPTQQNIGFDFGNSFTFFVASVADTMIPWGANIAARDKQLREFYPTEPILASAVGSVVMRDAAFDWKIEGPKYTREAVTQMLYSAISGNTIGWIPFIESVVTDLETQDNGAFIEIIRAEDDPASAVIGLGHLDAAMCKRTASIEYPVIYTDEKGSLHKLAWYQVVPISDLPSPNVKMKGAGMCAVSRVLRMSQILKDLQVYKHEKISGRFARAIHFVGGASRKDIDDIEKRSMEDADNKGLTRFILPMILTSLDPEKPVSHVEVPLASLPDGFKFDEELKWYIAIIALGFGGDYQDFAPLPGGNLGTSTQSEILHRKSRGKGPAFFMNFIRDVFKYRGIVPRNVEFSFYEQDLAADKERAQLSQIRAGTRAIQMRSGEINQAIARKLAVRTDDLEEEDITKEMLKQADVVKPQTYLGAGRNNLNAKSPSAGMLPSGYGTQPGPVPQ